MNSLDRRTYCNTADRFLPEAVLLPSLYQEKCYIYTYLPCLSFSYQSYGNDSLNLHIMFQTNKKGRIIYPTPSLLSGFIFPYLRYFLMCRFLLHLIHTSSLKCICIILILLRLSDHWRVYNLCFHSLSFCPLRFRLFLHLSILHMLFLIHSHIYR